MAENGLGGVVGADNLVHTLRSSGLGGSLDTQLQWAAIVEAPRETPVDPTGGTVRYTVGSGAVVALDDPTAAALFARLRVFETTTKDGLKRLYYRQDNVNPTNNGANAVGFLLHGEAMLVKLGGPSPTWTQFKMIADGTDAGSFEVYVEWLTLPPS